MAIAVPTYSYVHVGGTFDDRLRKAAWRFRTNLTKRRGTKKTDMVDNYIAAVEESLEAWPIVPFGYEFEREHVLRVWLQVEGDATQKAPRDAVLFCELPLDLLVRAGLADKNTKQLLLPYLLVPEAYWIWSAGALSFEKVIMTVLQDTIREHALTHKDTEGVREELVWIGPVGEEDLMYYFVVLTQIGIRPRINPEKANRSFFAGVPSVPSVAGIQRTPDTNFIWEWLLRIEAEKVTRRGTLPDGRNGQEALDTLFRDPIVNFLRDLADVYQGEEFELMIDRGGFGRGEIEKAISNGFGKHLPDDQRRALWAKWLERADVEDGLKPAVRAMRAGNGLFGYGQALTQILRHAGQGWTNPQKWGDLLVKLAWRSSCLDGAAELQRMKRTPGIEPDDIRDAARKMYVLGKISWREVVKFGGVAGKPDPYDDAKIYKGIAAELEVELEGTPARPGVLAQHKLYFKD